MWDDSTTLHIGDIYITFKIKSLVNSIIYQVLMFLIETFKIQIISTLTIELLEERERDD